MKRNSRLALALHTLGHMAEEPSAIMSSKDIAAHAKTNPVVVRRVLGKLRDAGLLRSEKGHFGGWQLAKAPARITLAHVYAALEERLVSSDTELERIGCSLEHTLHQRVSDVLLRTEKQLLNELSAITLSDLGSDADTAESHRSPLLRNSA